MTLGNSNDRDPQPHDLPIDAGAEAGGDADAGAAAENEGEGEGEAEGQAAAPSSGSSSGGPYNWMIDLAERANVSKLLLPVLAFAAIGAFIWGIIEPHGDVVPTLLLIIYILILGTTIISVANDLLSRRSGGPPILNRILLLFGLVILGFASSVIVDSCTPSSVAKALAGSSLKTCVDPPFFSGRVHSAADKEDHMPFAKVVIQSDKKEEITATDQGDFTVNFDKSDIGRKVTAWAIMEGYRRGKRQTATLISGLNEMDLELNPQKTRASAPQFETLAVPVLSKAIATTSGIERVAVRDVAEAKTNFNGHNWRYDIFYCQPPQGDVTRSKILALQMQKVLQAQSNVAAVRVKMWPSSNTPGYRIPDDLSSATIIINNRDERTNITSSLKQLWQPYLASGESIVLRAVDSKFDGYISLLACRSGRAGT